MRDILGITPGEAISEKTREKWDKMARQNRAPTWQEVNGSTTANDGKKIDAEPIINEETIDRLATMLEERLSDRALKLVNSFTKEIKS